MITSRCAGRMLWVAALALGMGRAEAVELHGYLRSGIGGNSAGGSQICFRVPGSDYKMRLGNECTSYGEFLFSETAYKDDTGVTVTPKLMVSFESGNSQQDEAYGAAAPIYVGGGSPNGRVAIQGMWVEVKGIPFLFGGTAWAGVRKYQQHAVGPFDYKYWNTSGPGGGIEYINLGFAKLSLAVLQFKNLVNESVFKPDARLKVEINPGGTIELGGTVEIYSSNGNLGPQVGSREKVSPFLTVEHVQTFSWGSNTLALQYGEGMAANLHKNPALTNTKDDSQRRLVEQFSLTPQGNFQATLYGIYQDKRGATDAASSTHLGVGVRPLVFLGDHFLVQGEVGYQSVKSKAAGAQALSMWKATLAPTVVSSRTRTFELRSFVTWARWNDALQAAGGPAVGPDGKPADTSDARTFGNAKSGFTFGLQGEIGW